MKLGQSSKWLVHNGTFCLCYIEFITGNSFLILYLIQVFCSGWQPDKQYDFWIVIPPYKQYRQSGGLVPFNSIIGLKHQQTGRNLHSHGGQESPKTRQQEGK